MVDMDLLCLLYMYMWVIIIMEMRMVDLEVDLIDLISYSLKIENLDNMYYFNLNYHYFNYLFVYC
jgi:hypothetical protein